MAVKDELSGSIWKKGAPSIITAMPPLTQTHIYTALYVKNTKKQQCTKSEKFAPVNNEFPILFYSQMYLGTKSICVHFFHNAR